MVIYFAFAALLIVSSVIDFANGHWKLGLVEFLIFGFLLLGAMALRRRERMERLLPPDEPAPRWY
jgi:membrane protein implicated in regulation of membrane protease activity